MTEGSAWRRLTKNASLLQLYSNTKVHVAQKYTISPALCGMWSCRKTGHIYRQKKTILIDVSLLKVITQKFQNRKARIRAVQKSFQNLKKLLAKQVSFI